MNTQFYKSVLPSQGIYCVTSIGKAGFARNLFAESLDDLLATIETASQGDNNVYFALSSFKGHSRKADNAQATRSFFVDLDVGEGKGYESKDAAYASLLEFVERVELPPPVIVDSGNGIHAYWPFEDDVDPATWKTYAEKFKAFCLAKGLKIDPAVTADVSRVLRCPNTYNHKNDIPVQARLLTEEIYNYSFESFVDFLGVVPAANPLGLAGVIVGLDDDTAALARRDDDYEYVFTDIAIKSLEGQGCKQIKYILENAANLPEPLWYAGLSVAGRCVDKDTAIHQMSIDYEGYSFEETVRKTEQSLKEATWAHGCDAFNRINPGTCDGCPFRGKVSSPIKLGRRLKLAEAPQEDPCEEVSQEGAEADPIWKAESQAKEKLKPLPSELYPFVRGANGGIYFLPPDKVDKEGVKHQQDPIKVFSHDTIVIKRVKGGPEGDSLIVKTIAPLDPQQDFILPIRSIYVQDEMKKRLPDNGVYPEIPAIAGGYVSSYFHKWATYLQNVQRAEIMRGQMGWTEDYDAFIMGLTELRSDGSERSAAAGQGIAVTAKLVRKAGSFEVWKQHAAMLNRPGWELHALGLLCGFGSPLMTFTPISGVTFCFMNPMSGTGKTGSMYAGLSVFAHPHDASLIDKGATKNAHIGRYLSFKNMMFGLDEVSNINGEFLSELVHRISQGKAKVRMQSSVNAEREVEQSASMIAMFTSNKDLYEVLRAFKGSPDGEMARLVQFTIRKPPSMDGDSAEGREVFDAFNTNYGHAGDAFIKYLFSKGIDYVKATVNRWYVRFEKEMRSDSAYRHYVAGLAAAFAGGELAAEARIINYDLERIYDAVMVEIMQLVDNTVKLNQIDYKSLLSDFIHKNHSGFLVLDNERVVSEPRTALVGRIEVHNSMQYISKREFRLFLAGLQISAAEFEKAVKRDGLLVESKKCRLSTGWKAGMVTPPISVFAFRSDELPAVLAKSNES